MNSDARGSNGQRVRRVPADIWNGMVGAGQQYNLQQLGQAGQPQQNVRRSDVVKIKNKTGEQRRKGEIVTLGNLVTTELSADHFWLEGNTTVRGHRFVILRYHVANDQIIEAQITGLTTALIYVNDTSHRFARVPDDGTFVLQSSPSGPVEILYLPTDAQEEDEVTALVRIREIGLPVYKTPSGGIPARSGTTCGSAECVPYIIEDDGEIVELLDEDQQSMAHEVFNMFGSDIGGSVYITVKDVHGCMQIDAEDCG
jgi:hypothetical protein